MENSACIPFEPNTREAVAVSAERAHLGANRDSMETTVTLWCDVDSFHGDESVCVNLLNYGFYAK